MRPIIPIIQCAPALKPYELIYMGPHFMLLLSIYVLYYNVTYIYPVSCFVEINCYIFKIIPPPKKKNNAIAFCIWYHAALIQQINSPRTESEFDTERPYVPIQQNGQVIAIHAGISARIYYHVLLVTMV